MVPGFVESIRDTTSSYDDITMLPTQYIEFVTEIQIDNKRATSIILLHLDERETKEINNEHPYEV